MQIRHATDDRCKSEEEPAMFMFFSWTCHSTERETPTMLSMSKTDIPLADADATGTRGKEDPSPIPGADADTEEAVTAAPVGVTFEVEGGVEEGDDKLGNEDTNPRGFVTWESRGASYQFANNPMRHGVWILLVLRAVHMGLVFGTNIINPGFLTGESEMYDLLR